MDKKLSKTLILVILVLSAIIFFDAKALAYQDIGLRIFDGTEIVIVAIEDTGTLTSPLRIVKNGTVYGIVLVDPSDTCASNIRIQTRLGIKAFAIYSCSSGYSLNYLARKYSGFGGTPWYALISDNNVIGGQDRSNITYSTVQGNWVPTDTSTETLSLNVNGERNQGGSDPRSGFQVKYRVWSNTKVRVQAKTWGETGRPARPRRNSTLVFSARIDRTDTFQRESETSILINGASQPIAAGATYEIQRATWNPGDNGSGYSYLSIVNVDSGYFDVEVVVWEYDEEYDSAHTRIESYIVVE